MKNIVKFNLKNVYYAPLTIAEDGTPSWGTPVPIPGAVSLSMSAQGDITPFYADGRKYYVATSNNGYSGDLTIALVPDSFLVDVLNMELDASKKILAEYNDRESKNFALLFQFDGDQHGTRHILYNCTATRPQVNGETTTQTKTPQTESIAIDAAPLANGLVRARTSDETSEADYNAWFTAVIVPTSTGGEV